MFTKGIFISLEGIDGCGKTTLKDNLLDIMGKKYEVMGVREPGGTVISEKIRDMLLDVRNDGIIGKTEAILYAAARSQLVEEVIRPALEQGKIVVADRYMDSTIAYQGYGRGLDLEFLENLNLLCTGGINPDLTLLLDIDPYEGLKRRKKNIPDRLEIEGMEFQARIRKGYLELLEKDPIRIKRIDATLPPDELVQEALKIFENNLHKYYSA
jgi:dTMP kinase